MIGIGITLALVGFFMAMLHGWGGTADFFGVVGFIGLVLVALNLVAIAANWLYNSPTFIQWAKWWFTLGF